MDEASTASDMSFLDIPAANVGGETGLDSTTKDATHDGEETNECYHDDGWHDGWRGQKYHATRPQNETTVPRRSCWCCGRVRQ
jgi:hypothetical protein